MSMQTTLMQGEIDTLLAVFPKGVIALDLETTGLSPLINKIIEIGAVKVTPDSVVSFNQLINPEVTIPQVTIDIHGITDEMVKDAATSNKVLPEFLNFCEDLPLIAHNAKFDMGFLIYEMHNKKLISPKVDIFCSCHFSRYTFKNFPNHRLSTLVKTLDIPLENHHRAYDDALACLRVFIKILDDYKKTDNLHPNVLSKALLFNLADYSYKNPMQVPEHLKLLEEIVESQTPVDIIYRGGSHKNKWRPIRPISLLPMPNGDMLYAHCLISDVYKSFALHKITDIRLPVTDNKE